MNHLMTFAEGLASFISPCTLPLMPVFVAYFAADGKHPLKRALAFVFGFSAVFIALGIASASAGAFLAAHQAMVKIVSGAILIVMALVFIEIIPLKLPWSGKAGAPPASATIFGALFAVNLTPCVGAFLAAALVAAADSKSAAAGAALLATYSLGLAVPFVAAAIALSRLNWVFARVKSGYRVLVPVCALALLGYGGWMIYCGATSPAPEQPAAPIETAAEEAQDNSPQTFGEVVEVQNLEEFKRLTAEGTAIVDFWAPWCGPCRRMAPVLHEIAAEYQKVKVIKVNVDDFQELAQSYMVTGIPAIFRFDDGAVSTRSVGAVPKSELIERLRLK